VIREPVKPTAALLYLPVLHAGYAAFLGDPEPPLERVFVLGHSFEEEFPVLRKEIRALEPETAAALVRTLLPSAEVSVVQPTGLDVVFAAPLLVPDEALMRELVEQRAPAEQDLVAWRRTFLRWDREWSKPQPVESPMTEAPDGARDAMRAARLEAGQSSDWWRQVGAVLRLQDGRELTGHNHHHPSDYTPYVDGDPRNDYSRGVRADLSTAAHAEASVLAAAARAGASTEGSTMFVTTFPCPACARLIAMSGVADCYFEADYADLAGEQVLRSAGVGLHRVTWGD
jgi:dCMP deaminase